MKLSAAYLAVAIKLQEAADLSAGDVAARLRDAINDCYRGTGKWAYYIDHFGDDTSGDVIYSCDGDTMRAPYEISDAGGAAKCVIDTERAEDVVPRTIYEPEMDEAEHYASMEESLKTEKLYASLPLYERFISKAERKAASADDFAGKGRSFPILKPSDIMAAVHSMGRAGSANLGPSGIKGRIIAIAKRKGWEKYLPKAWQSSDAKESATATQAAAAGTLSLQESAATLDRIVLQEARADYEIKLIAPGKGSTAYYPPEVLKRDGPKAFPSETKVYLNHPTSEAEGPGNRDVNRLAGVLTTAAQYHESHAKGPGLYARMKVFADHGQMLEEKSPYLGMSIMANGQQAREAAGKLAFKEGVPLLASLDDATGRNLHSVDVVPIAGAGGVILQEAARPQEVGMDEATQKLIESAVNAAVAAATAKVQSLESRALRGDAREEAARLLESVTLPAASKLRVIESVLGNIPVKDNALDAEAFAKIVESAAKAEGQYVAALTGSGRVYGMGPSAAAAIDPKEAERRAQAAKQEEADTLAIFESLGMPEGAAKFAAKGRAN